MELIEINQKIMLGKPVIKGTRITVEHIISLLSQDISIDEILVEYNQAMPFSPQKQKCGKNSKGDACAFIVCVLWRTGGWSYHNNISIAQCYYYYVCYNSKS